MLSKEQPQMKKIQQYAYDATKPLGKGSFGTVYEATDTRTNQKLAVKVIPNLKLFNDNGKIDDIFLREINVQLKIKSDHVVRLIDVKRTANNLYVFTDLCEEGDLEEKIKAGHKWTEEEACDILRQITDAFISMGNVMHRDIKPANILLSKGKVKVADFGFAKVIDEVDKEIRLRHTLLGTPLFMPPQILDDKPYSAKCDVWSAGCVFYELLFGQTPWNGRSVAGLLHNIKTKPLSFPKEVKPETQHLLKRMLEPEEALRISWKEVWEHPALQPEKKQIKTDDKNEKVDEKYEKNEKFEPNEKYVHIPLKGPITNNNKDHY